MRIVEAFVMEVAGLATYVQPMFFSTREYCHLYLTERNPDFFVEVTPEDLIHQQAALDQEADREGLRRRKFTDHFLERTVIQAKIAGKLLERGTLLLHGSTVAVDGQAYLFTAPCGTGKSTHTRFWREQFGDRAVMVNDDKVFLQLRQEGVWAYGSPWTGKHGIGTNISMPLKGICFLQRGTENLIQKAMPEKWQPELIHQCFMPEERYFPLVWNLAQMVPLWEMSCTKDPQAATIAYEVMSRVM
ncbi:MAG: hypothetical protein IJX01_02280 [Oscillospiraceae bacterium]|nr:hypothetical protein [Oscillospiraceae bacterium]